MIKAEIRANGKSAIIEFPTSIEDTHSDLRSIGVLAPLSRIKISDSEDERYRVHLFSDNDVGSHLIRLFSEKDTLDDVDTVTTAILHSREEIRDDLEANILYDQYSSPAQVLGSIRDMTYDLGSVSETFYFPLTAKIYDAEYGDDYEVGNDFILDYKGQVEETLMFYANMGGINMAEYYEANGKDKLLMADWGLETMKGTVYGKVDIRLTEPFTPEETAAFKDWTLGQNSDGLGEGFEQQDIKTDEGALNVSFWHSGNDYFIYTQEEMDEYINQNHGMNMEGM